MRWTIWLVFLGLVAAIAWVPDEDAELRVDAVASIVTQPMVQRSAMHAVAEAVPAAVVATSAGLRASRHPLSGADAPAATDGASVFSASTDPALEATAVASLVPPLPSQPERTEARGVDDASTGAHDEDAADDAEDDPPKARRRKARSSTASRPVPIIRQYRTTSHAGIARIGGPSPSTRTKIVRARPQRDWRDRVHYGSETGR